MVQNQKLVSAQGKRGVNAALVVVELDRASVPGDLLNHGADLLAPQTAFRQVFHECNLIV
jgi:hypothetical protein